jgi:endonuclease/exonuclease/phosphatase family metal-dependent hydrolase
MAASAPADSGWKPWGTSGNDQYHAIPSFVFDSERREWVTLPELDAVGESSVSGDPALELGIATFNVWFDGFAWERRCDHLISLLVGMDAGRIDVACLQEVTARFLRRFLTDPRVRETFVVSDSMDCVTLGRYGVLTVVRRALIDAGSRVTFREILLPTGQGRKGLVVRLDATALVGKDSVLSVGNVHLESLGSMPTRTRQLQILSEYLTTGSGSSNSAGSVLLGDFNITGTGIYGGDGTENRNIKKNLPGFLDSYAELHLGSEDDAGGETFDTSTNAMTRPTSSSFERSRYDRIMVRGCEFTSAAIFGDQEVPGGPENRRSVLVSDHYGLRTQVNVSHDLEDRRKLSASAKLRRWSEVFEILERRPYLRNACNPSSNSGFTPLHQVAYAGGDEEVARRLLDEYGCSKYVKNADGQTPVAVAREVGASHLVELLK